MKSQAIFRAVWWTSNLLLVAALMATAYSAVWEISVRQYLRAFSDAVVPEAAPARQKADAILAWMKNGPPRLEGSDPTELSPRDPEDTLNYRQLTAVCGSATNAFLNLSRSAGLQTRRLLLLTPEGTTKHVVAEVNVEGRWVIADPSYRAFLKDAKGNLLTRKELQDPETFREATGSLRHYPAEYTYDRFAHVRVETLPFHGAGLRSMLDHVAPGWEEHLDWSLLLERRSFACFYLAVAALVFLLLVRLVLGWLADHRLHLPRSGCARIWAEPRWLSSLPRRLNRAVSSCRRPRYRSVSLSTFNPLACLVAPPGFSCSVGIRGMAASKSSNGGAGSLWLLAPRRTAAGGGEYPK